MTGRLWLVTVALLLGWASGLPILAVFVVAYLFAWGVRAYVMGAGGRAPPAWIAVVAALVVAALTVVSRGPTIADTEQLTGLSNVLADRDRIQRDPVIAPAVITDDRPQRLYLTAPGASRAELSFGWKSIDAVPLGHGLFVVDYDPRQHGPPHANAILHVDGREHSRSVIAYRATPHPRWPCTGAAAVAIPSEETDTLTIVDEHGTKTTTTADGPSDCVILDDGRIVVTHRYDDRVRIGNEMLDVGAGQVRVAARAGEIAVAVREPAAVFRIATGLVGSASVAAEHRALPYRPDWIVFAPDGDVVASSREAHLVWRVGRDAAPIRFGRPPITIATSPSGRRLFVALSDYRPDGDAGRNHAIEEQIVTIDLEAWRIVDRDPTGAFGATPTGLFPLGEDEVVVTLAGSDKVVRIDLDNGSGSTVHSDVIAPHGVGRLHDRWIVASLPTPETFVQRGERAFYEATRSGLSCATCHLHGTSDHSLHDIGHDVARPTLDLHGVARTAPYLRGASYSSLGALHAFGVGVLGGWARSMPDRRATLEAYVETIPRPDAPRIDPDAQARGLDLFVRAGCAACHRPGPFTDLAQIPSSALFPARDEHTLLDTPSLIGAGGSAPYLHDGRANTIREVMIDHNPAGRHGNASELDEDELAALIRFVEAL